MFLYDTGNLKCHIFGLIVLRSLVFRSSGGTGSGSGAGGGGGGGGGSKPATRQIRTRARIMRSNTAIRGGSNSGKKNLNKY